MTDFPAHPARLARRARRARDAVRARLAAVLAAPVWAIAPAPAAAGEPPPPLPVVTAVQDLGLVAQNRTVACRDGTYSARVAGRAVWTFNDTCLTRAGVSGLQFIDNSLAWTDTFDASSGLALDHDFADRLGVPRRFVPFTPWELHVNRTQAPDGIAIWPGQLVDDPARHRALIFYGTVYRGPDIGFSPVGAGIAVASRDLRTVIRPRESTDPDAKEPSYMWSRGEQAYTGGYVRVGDMLYCYGGQGKFLRTLVHVARVPMADVLDKTKWRYWDGAGWNADPSASQWVYEGGAAGDTVFWNDALGVFMTVYMPFGSNDVHYRVARHPEGPWSAAALMFTAQQGTDTSYAGRVHTEYAEQDGLVQYVTYVEDTGFLQQVLPLVKVTFAPAR